MSDCEHRFSDVAEAMMNTESFNAGKQRVRCMTCLKAFSFRDMEEIEYEQQAPSVPKKKKKTSKKKSSLTQD